TTLPILTGLAIFIGAPGAWAQGEPAGNAPQAGMTSPAAPSLVAQETAPAQPAAPAPPPPKIDTGDTAWLLTSSALVLAMTAPGVAMFYGGMVRRKNALNTILMSFIILCLISVQRVMSGYRPSFSPYKAHRLGGLEW